ncbi:MAG: NADH-quinone oxidoreductase subunit L, partial [Verrucomicrobiales bacterium]
MPWLLLILPLAAAVIISLFTRKNGPLSAYISVASVLATLAISVLLHLQAAKDHPSFTWIAAGDFNLNIGIMLDALSRAMMLIVT